MKVCIIGGGGQVADALGALLRQNNIDTIFYRPERIIIPGIPIRPKRPQKYFYDLQIGSTDLTVIEKADFHYNWFDESKLKSCDVFIFAMPSYLAEPIAKRLAPYISNKVFINISDRFLGTYAMNVEILKAKYPQFSMAIAFNSPPLISYQPIRNEHTSVYYDKSSVYIGCFPKNKIDEAKQLVSYLFNLPKLNIKVASSLLELAFENTQSIIHAVQDLYNLKNGKYAKNGFGSRYDVDVYTDEMVARVNRIIQERDKVSLFYLNKRFRNIEDYDSASNKNFKKSEGIEYGTALYRRSHTVLNSVPRPSIYYAHGYEDIGWSMVPLESIAIYAGIPTPNLTALINEWCAYMHNDYRKSGRTIESLNLKPQQKFETDIVPVDKWIWWSEVL